MLLLHISDIHFRTPHCTKPDTDPDLPYRTELVRDVFEWVTKLGPVDAILITGDIAFKGDPGEYAVARVWIEELANTAHCDLTRVYVVPGNHDVNRDTIAKEPAICDVQAAILKASDDRREATLRQRCENTTTGRSLFQPIEAYNVFASAFNCQVYPLDRLYWKQDLELGRGVRLRLHGLTSTLLSGAVHDERKGDRQEDARGGLYLSPLQTVLNREEDVINLAMAHHPSDWYMDHDDVDDAMNGRATLQLFGHKHKQRIVRERAFVRFQAGAVNPDRFERGWIPCYNLIRLEVVGTGAERKLEIEAWLLEWQSNPDQFKPRRDGDRDSFHHTITFPSRSAPRTAGTIAPAGARQAAPVPPDLRVEVAMSDRSSRNLMMRFWDLPSSIKYKIAIDLGLIEEADTAVPEPERYAKAFRRACGQGLLEKLDEEVTKCQARQ